MTHATVPLHPSLQPISAAELAMLGFLARYTGATHKLYNHYLKQWVAWVQQQRDQYGRPLELLAVTRTHVEVYIRQLEAAGRKPSTIGTAMVPVRGFYKFAYLDGMIDRDPAAAARLPRVRYELKEPLSPTDLIRFLEVARDTSPRHHALAQLLGVMALRINEACSLDVTSYSTIEQGYPVLRFIGKGNKPARMPVPFPVLQALEGARAGRTEGPLIARRDGGRLDRSGGAGLVETINRRGGFKRYINPHLLRAAAITTALDSGIPLHEAAEFARHEDPRTTAQRYNLNKGNLSRNPVHTVAARLAL